MDNNEKFNFIPKIVYLKSIIEENYSFRIKKIDLYKIGNSYIYNVYSSGKRYLFKLFDNVYDNHPLQSFQIIDFLYQNDFEVPQIIRNSQSELYIKISTPSGDWIGGLFEFVELSEIDIKEDLLAVAELTAHMHTLMKKYNNTIDCFKKDFYIDRMINILKKYYPNDSRIDFFSKCGRMIFDKVELLPKAFCHGDFGLHNIYRSKKGITVINFDASSNSYPMFDITLVCDMTNFWEFNIKKMQQTKDCIDNFASIYTKYVELSQLEIDSYLYFLSLRQFEVRATVASTALKREGSYFLNSNYINDFQKWLNAFFEYVS